MQLSLNLEKIPHIMKNTQNDNENIRFLIIKLFVIVTLALISLPTAHAEQAYALAPGNMLIGFDTATPSNTTTLAIIGLSSVNETLRGIDVQPTTGELFVSSVTTSSAANSIIKTYQINPATGITILIGATAAALAGAGDIPTAYDFNPTVNRIRYANTNDENARFNPDTGALTANDTDLTPAMSSDIIAAAYDRNFLGSTLTTLYVVNRASSTIATMGGINGSPSPNTGVITNQGSLGIILNAANDAGFDISPTGIAYAALTNNATGLTGLYIVNLALGAGAATLVGNIGDGSTQIYSLTFPLPDSDSDGIFDFQDSCPEFASTNPNGCPAIISEAPDTLITKLPKASTKNRSAIFEFSSTQPSSSFECSIDNTGFRSCTSPKRYRRLNVRRHDFMVRAINSAGVVDLSPASAKWKVRN